VGTLGVRLPVGVGVELLEDGRHQGVLGQGLEDGLAVPGAHLPAGHVLHQLGLLVPVAAQLAQEFPIPLGYQNGEDDILGGSHLDLVALHLLSGQVVDAQANSRDGHIAADHGEACRYRGLAYIALIFRYSMIRLTCKVALGRHAGKGDLLVAARRGQILFRGAMRHGRRHCDSSCGQSDM